MECRARAERHAVRDRARDVNIGPSREKRCMTWLKYNEALQELPDDTEMVVGSGAQATWRVQRADLMPKHFIVSNTDGRVRIRPFSSDAVVAIGGRQVSTEGTELRDGAVIRAGSAQISFWSDTPGQHDPDADASAPGGHLIDTRRRVAHVLRRTSTGIGRDESNSLVVQDPSASRFQAEIRSEAGAHALRTMGSGVTKVNGKPLGPPVLLTEGDEVEIADLVLRYTRAPLPAGVKLAQSTDGAGSTAETIPERRPAAPTPPLGGAVSMELEKTPMRYVAIVSSLIAALAVGTFLFMHRIP